MTQGLRSSRSHGTAAQTAYAQDVLALLGRFGVATRDQVARHTGRSPAAVERAQQTLAAQGLVRPVPLVLGGGLATAALTLTAAGMHRLPAAMPKQRVSLRQLEAALTALDIAWAVEAEGHGQWLTWPEALAAGHARGTAGDGAVADGLILRPEGEGPLPVCIVLARPRRRAWRQRLAEAARAAAAQGVRVYAPPHLCAELAESADGLRATVLPWGPPRAAGAAGAPRPGRRDALTPKRLRALVFLGRFGYATVDQVGRAQGTHATAASIMLATLERLGLVQRYRRHHLHKDVYSATELGICAAGLEVPPVPPVPLQRHHALALVDLAHELCAETGGGWLTDREVCGRTLQRRPPHQPAGADGTLCLPDGRRVAVQLEWDVQARRPVREFVSLQLNAGGCDEVWYVVPPHAQERYTARLRGVPATRVRAWEAPDRLGGPRGFRADRQTRAPLAPRILGRARREAAAGRGDGGAQGGEGPPRPWAVGRAPRSGRGPAS